MSVESVGLHVLLSSIKTDFVQVRAFMFELTVTNFKLDQFRAHRTKHTIFDAPSLRLQVCFLWLVLLLLYLAHGQISPSCECRMQMSLAQTIRWVYLCELGKDGVVHAACSDQGLIVTVLEHEGEHKLVAEV